MKVEYSYLIRQFSNAEPILDAVRRLLQTGDFTLGHPLSEFETRFAKLCQTKYVIGVNSGTDALFLTMKVLGIGPGDEVITAPNSFIATAGAIAIAGARPVFVDVSDDYNIDVELIEKAITPRTKAIIPVHLTGNPADMPKIVELATRHNLHVIEDCAQAVNAHIDGKPVGSFGVAGCYSMHPLKNLNVWGDGGIIATDSKELYDKLILMRNHGLRNRDECDFFSYNSRLDTLQAVVALQVVDELDSITKTRIANARTYDAGLAKISEYVTTPPRRKNVQQVYHQYAVRAEERDKLIDYLAKNGVEAKIHYPIPIHLQRASKYLGYKEGDFPVCEAQAKSIVSLPIHQYLTKEQLDYVVNTAVQFYGG